MISARHLAEKLQQLDEYAQARPVILIIDGDVHKVQDVKQTCVWHSSYFCSASVPMIELTHESVNKEYDDQKSRREGHQMTDETTYAVEIQSEGRWFRLSPLIAQDSAGLFKTYDDAVQFAKRNDLKKYRILKEQRTVTLESVTSRIGPED